LSLTKSAQFTRRWLAIAIGWLIFGLFNATESSVIRSMSGPVNVKLHYEFSLLDALGWFLLTPAILSIAPRRLRLWQQLLTYFVAGVAIAVAHLWLLSRMLPFIGYKPPGHTTLFKALLPAGMQSDTFLPWALMGIREAVMWYRRARERELSLTQARLEVLRGQLQPHFLFNTLNTISSLMYKDVPAADRVLNRLADFLRIALESAKAQEVCLETELEYTDRYLDIERVRFQDRLRVEREIEPESRGALVPTLILQPLVENALRHGVGTRAGGGTMWIRARRRDTMLAVEVEDEGWPPKEIKEGLGLSNARARLETLYGERQRLWIDRGASGGFRVSLELPYHT
jgi:two-component system, LytTR family, sensor kinase